MIASAAAASGVFLLLFFALDWNLFFSALLCVGLYFGLFLVLRPNRKIAGMDVEAVPGGEEIRRLLDEAQKDLSRMEKDASAIRDAGVQADAGALCGAGQGILSYLEENPEKIRLARRFFTYYLDVAVKLLSRYVDFQNTGLSSEEVTGILKKTAEALPVLNKAFERQFTRLMEGELLDVEADIELLKSTLKLEGGK